MSEALENEIRTLRAHFWSERDPEGRAFAPLADAYLRKGDLDEAHALLEDGLGRIPDFTSGHLIAARVHRARGDDEAFRSSVERLLEIDGDNAAGLRLFGEVLEADGKPREALDAFRRALASNPEYDDLESRITRLEMDAPSGSTRSSEAAMAAEPDTEVESGFDADPAPGPEYEELDPDGPESDLRDDIVDDIRGDLDADTESVATDPDDDFRIDDFGAVTLSQEEDPSAGDPFDLAWEEKPTADEEIPADDEDPLLVDELEAGDGTLSDPELSPEALLETERGSPIPDAAGWSPGTGSSALSDADREVVLEGEPSGELPPPDSDQLEPELPDSAEPAAPEAGPSDDSPTVTRTLGELYFRQGLSVRAIEVYEELVRRSPGDEALRQRLEEIRSEVDRPTEEQTLEEQTAEELEPDEPGSEELESEERAPQWTDETDEDPSLEMSTPFAWNRAEHPEDQESPDETAPAPEGRSIADYLGDLRAWEPGAIPIEALDPETVPIEALAPGGAAADPDDGEPGSASPDPDPAAVEGGEGGLDDFQDWLRGLRS